MLALALMGLGCNPFASVQQKIEARVGEELGERLLEGSVGGGVDLEIGRVPANYPKDALFYPGTEVRSAVLTSEGRIAISNMTTKDDQEKVVEWYDREYVALGFEKDEDIAKLGMFRVYEKGNVKITVQTQRVPNQDITAVTVTRAEVK